VTIKIQQTVIPGYRLPLFEMLKDRLDDELRVVTGSEDFAETIRTADGAESVSEVISNRYCFGRRFLWQRGAVRKLCSADVVVLNFNLRIVSNIVIAWVRCMMGKPTYIWGHADGKSCLTRRFGWLYLKAVDGFISYTETQREVMQQRCSKLPVFVAPNACFHAADCVATEERGRDIVFLGRLVKEKKPKLLLEAFAMACGAGRMAQDSRLIFIGDGPEKLELERFVLNKGLRGRIVFAGHVAEMTALQGLFSSASVCVCPGYAGLSVTQSMAFGVPVLVADNEPHSPEIEACENGWNAVYFNSDDAESLAERIVEFVGGGFSEILHGQELADWTKRRYSYERMADTFEEVVELAKKCE